MSLTSRATYRQNKSNVIFQGGSFDIELNDGQGYYVPGCVWTSYVPPTSGEGCGLGSNTFLIFGDPFDNGTFGPYFALSSIVPATFIEPARPELCFLTAAPASTLPRPLAGFVDNGYALYYNLHTSSIRQYTVTNYSTSRRYTKDQRAKFVSDIVPGAYYYSFPRLGSPNLPVAVSAQIYPMPEGLAKINNQEVGLKFTNFGTWNGQGFMQVSYNKPIIFTWQGLIPSVVFSASDSLYLSLRVLSDPKDPTSPTDLVDNTTGFPQSIFPAIQSGSDPRVVMTSPYVTSFTAPPIFDGGTRAVLELQLERSLQTGAVAYDLSKRTFQIPIIVVNKYSDYQDVVFKGIGSKIGILEDNDGDGYNNLNEWILDSNASQAASIPIAPVPTFNVNAEDPTLSYFGFTIKQKLGTNPAVVYTLQRSINGGRTWTTFESDPDWIVNRYRYRAGQFPNQEIDPAQAFIRVESRTGTLPVGTFGHLYRVKITLK